MRCACVASLLVVLGTTGISAQSEPQKHVGRVVGVFDDRTGQPIEGAEVRDMASGSSALTTSTGTLSLFFVDTAGSLVRIRKVGYEPVIVFVNNSRADSVPLTLTLQPVAQWLPKVLTTAARVQYINPALNEFEERRSHGLGRFIPETTLRREEHRTLGSVIMSYVTGLNIVQGRLSSEIPVTLRGCRPDIYLDGLLVAMNVAGRQVGQPDLSIYKVRELAGVEFHTAATLPIQYSRPGGGCGALLLWSRER